MGGWSSLRGFVSANPLAHRRCRWLVELPVSVDLLRSLVTVLKELCLKYKRFVGAFLLYFVLSEEQYLSRFGYSSQNYSSSSFCWLSWSRLDTNPWLIEQPQNYLLEVRDAAAKFYREAFSPIWVPSLNHRPKVSGQPCFIEYPLTLATGNRLC